MQVISSRSQGDLDVEGSHSVENLDIVTEDTMDGGLKAYSTLLGGWLVMFTTFGYTYTFGVYQDFYTSSQVASASAISWIGSVQVFLLTSMGLFAGRLLDAGYFRLTILTGSILYTFSLFMLSLARPEHYYQLFLAQGLTAGIGSGLMYIPIIAIQSHHWRTHHALAVGIIFTGSSVGGIVFPIMINQLLHGSPGFAWSVRASAFVVLALLALANVLMFPRVGVTATTEKRSQLNLRALFADIPYVVFISGSFLCMWGIFYPYFYLQLYARTHGIDLTIAFYTQAIVNASSIPGRIAPHIAIKKFGVWNALIIFGFGSAALIFSLFGVHTVAGVLVFSILWGFFSGGLLTLMAATAASTVKDPGETGMQMGLAFAIGNIGSLTGPPINGALLGSEYHWFKTIIFSGSYVPTKTAMVAGSAIYIWNRYLVYRRDMAI